MQMPWIYIHFNTGLKKFLTYVYKADQSSKFLSFE